MKSANVVIVGAGPAGIAAARAASEAERSVVVIDDNQAPGGQIWRGRKQTIEGEWIPATRVISGNAASNTLTLEDASQAYSLRYEKLIFATGARELFLPFPGWTLPNVFGAGGLQAHVKSGLPLKGKAVVIAGSGPLLLAVASYLRKQGAIIPLIAEQASARSIRSFGFRLLKSPAKAAQALQLRASLLGTRYTTDCWITSFDPNGTVHLNTGSHRCDYLAVGYGLVPNTELRSLLGVNEEIYYAGGSAGLELALIEGAIAGYAATGQMEKAAGLVPTRKRAQKFANILNQTFAIRQELRSVPEASTIVCRCEEVTYDRLKDKTSFRQAKLHTRCGMGPCQGRICAPATQFLFGWQDTSVRPPIYPARIESLIQEGTAQ